MIDLKLRDRKLMPMKIVSYNIMPPLMNKMNIFAAIRKIYSSRNKKENNIQSS